MFRFKSFSPLFVPPSPIQVQTLQEQFDSNGISHFGYVTSSASSVDANIPKPSEYTMEFALQSGQLNPVSLDDYMIAPSYDNSVSFVNKFASSSNVDASESSNNE